MKTPKIGKTKEMFAETVGSEKFSDGVPPRVTIFTLCWKSLSLRGLCPLNNPLFNIFSQLWPAAIKNALLLRENMDFCSIFSALLSKNCPFGKNVKTKTVFGPKIFCGSEPFSKFQLRSVFKPLRQGVHPPWKSAPLLKFYNSPWKPGNLLEFLFLLCWISKKQTIVCQKLYVCKNP